MATICQTPQRLENRGMMWMIGAFVFCPCHLPITLSALALILGGTAAAGMIVTALWAAGTWRGLMLVRRARSFGEHVERP